MLRACNTIHQFNSLPVKKISSSFLLITACFGTQAQSIGPAMINAAGGSATIGGNIHEYAIATEVLGPVASLTVTPGPLQPAPTTAGIADAPGLAAQLLVFPNPAQSTVHIQPSLAAGDELSYTLADAAGKVVLRQTARLATGTERQTLHVGSLAAGSYLLTVFGSGSDQKAAFNIQKIQ